MLTKLIVALSLFTKRLASLQSKRVLSKLEKGGLSREDHYQKELLKKKEALVAYNVMKAKATEVRKAKILKLNEKQSKLMVSASELSNI